MVFHDDLILYGTFDQPSWTHIKSVFGSVVTVAFQIAFRAEIHVNDVFLFFKNYF
jgi:hypothetical protein